MKRHHTGGRPPHQPPQPGHSGPGNEALDQVLTYIDGDDRRFGHVDRLVRRVCATVVLTVAIVCLGGAASLAVFSQVAHLSPTLNVLSGLTGSGGVTGAIIAIRAVVRRWLRRRRRDALPSAAAPSETALSPRAPQQPRRDGDTQRQHKTRRQR